MAIRLTSTFKNELGVSYKIDIHDKNYSGTAVEYISGKSGFELTYEASGDDYLHSPVLASSVSIPVMIRDDNRAGIESFISDLSSADENRFLVYIYENSAIYWRGKVQVEQVQIPDSYYSEISIFAADGLGRLSSIPYTNGELFYYDYATVQEHIHNIISKLQLYETLTDTELCFVNEWTVTGLIGFFQDNVRIHHDVFKEDKNGTTLPYDCLTVLKQILQRFDFRIVQQNGIFFIEQLSYIRKTHLKNVQYYDAAGVFYSDTTASLNVSLLQKLAGGVSFFREPAKSCATQYAFKDGISSNRLSGTILYDTFYDDGYIPNANDEKFGFSIDFYIANIPPAVYQPNTFFFYKFYFTIKIGAYYYDSVNGWTTDSANRLILYSRQIDINDGLIFLQNIAAVLPTCPVDDVLSFKYSYETVDIDLNFFGDPNTSADIIRSNGFIVYGVNEPTEGTKAVTGYTGNVSGEVIELETLIIGDKPTGGAIGRLQYWNGTDWLNTFNTWGAGTPEGLNIDNLLIREILSMQRASVVINNMILRSDVKIASTIAGQIITRAAYVANENKWNIESFVTQYDNSGITYVSYVDAESGTAGIPSGVTPPVQPAVGASYWARVDGVLIPITSTDNIHVNGIQLETLPVVPAHSEGFMYWNEADKCIDVMSGLNESILQVGQESWIRVRNNTGTTIANGKAVYITGRIGNRPTVALARADSDTTSLVLGLTTEPIGNNEDGFVTTRGLVRSIDTSLYKENDTLYLSETNAGELTYFAPAAPNWIIRVGTVALALNNGIIDVDMRVDLTKHITVKSVQVYDTLTAAKAKLGDLVSGNYLKIGDGISKDQLFLETSGAFAIKAQSTNGNAFQAYATTGIAIKSNSVSNVAIQGESIDLIGVKGTSTSSNGVAGTNATGEGSGVYGVSDSADGYGVRGLANDGVGVFGESDNIAVWGESATGVGVRGSSAKFGNVDAGNYVDIDSDGNIELLGNATVWDDLRVPVNDLTAAGNNDPTQFNWLGNLIEMAFSATIMNELFFEVQIPHSYKEGSTIYPHVHFRPTKTEAGGTRVRWGLEYVWQNVGEVAPASTTTIYTTNIMPNEDLVDKKHYKSVFSGISGTGKTISSVLSCRIFRDATNAADTYTSPAGLIEIDFHYEMDTLGSSTEFVK